MAVLKDYVTEPEKRLSMVKIKTAAKQISDIKLKNISSVSSTCT